MRNRDLFQRVLELTVSDQVRTQNAPFLLGACVSNRANAADAWQFVATRWDEINERFPANTMVWLLGGVRTVNDEALAAEITAFLAEHPVPQAEKVVTQHLERMQVSVALRARERPRL